MNISFFFLGAKSACACRCLCEWV